MCLQLRNCREKQKVRIARPSNPGWTGPAVDLTGNANSANKYSQLIVSFVMRRKEKVATPIRVHIDGDGSSAQPN